MDPVIAFPPTERSPAYRHEEPTDMLVPMFKLPATEASAAIVA
jgi:hypothetical protein